MVGFIDSNNNIEKLPQDLTYKMQNIVICITLLFTVLSINRIEAAQNNKLGIYVQDEYGEHIIERTSRMGSTFTYVNLFWSEVELGQDKWDWKIADSKILPKIKNGIEVGIRLIASNHWATGSVRPVWAMRRKKGRKKRDSIPPKDLKREWNEKHGYSKDYYDFVYNTVKRYGEKVKYWAVENEITYKMNFTGGLEKYKLLLPTAYKAIKDARKDAYVVSHAPSSKSYGEAIAFELFKAGKTMEAVKFYNTFMFPNRTIPKPYNKDGLKKVFKKTKIYKKYKIIIDGFKNNKYYDIYQFHYYDKADMLNKVLNWIEDKKKKYSNDKPIVCWEMGYIWRKNRTYNKIDHAKDIFKKLVILLSHNITTITYHSIYGKSKKGDPWRGLYKNYSGLEKRPAAYVYENLIKMLKNAKYEGKSKLDDELYAYRFTKGKQKLYFLWSKETKTILLAEYLKNSKMYDLFGKIIQPQMDKIVISDRPVYFIQTVR